MRTTPRNSIRSEAPGIKNLCWSIIGEILTNAGEVVGGAGKSVPRTQLYVGLQRITARLSALLPHNWKPTDAIRRKVIEGDIEPVYYRGEIVGQVQKTSDIPKMFLMKARRPEQYRENAKIKVNLGDRLDELVDAIQGKRVPEKPQPE